MTWTFQQIKPMLLSIAILFGIVAECTRVEAAPLETAIVAGGCFWCVEHDFEQVKGVAEAVSGFIGGDVANPTYKQVSKGGTGHLEAVKITFDPAQISYAQVINLFFRSVDPTDAGGQFCDRGAHYATAIFATNADQAKVAEAEKTKAQRQLGLKVVTPIRQAGPFYPAGAYHQDYSKSTKVIVTRFGPRSKAKAYKLYREACGRDQRVQALWGDGAPFIN
ncbi:peptide-methionine (S)-S-oxide reductase MsrA [Actibacterium sp. 188UL27-1]|uniref:peptide-methionine (S)-S-oxide reductase MsrA n=1 Tax=Actibacterium sp. 188UL27-1 TaxID=2786961 RepID=UPI00195806C4|nr:peptide-methionine (S)-S-oxide reductase MsrA [Actibacterium sp. 188UL27-1]MBM7067058.1 peptide-methionine (S)-S-oxide reductase MsrA [Actibacterium sp. 188UL27-1]